MDFIASIQTNFSGAHSDCCKANFSVRLKYVGATRTSSQSVDLLSMDGMGSRVSPHEMGQIKGYIALNI